MSDLSSRVQDKFLQLENAETAFMHTRYHDTLQAIIKDKTIAVEEKAYKIISSKLFRSISFPKENQAFLREKITAAYTKKEKLTFILGFGAYKTYYSYSYPMPNFSEVFNILYMKMFAHVLKKAYPFGVEILYVPGLKDIASIVTAIPLENLVAYHNTLESLFNCLVGTNDSLTFINNKAQLKKLDTSIDDIKQVIQKNFYTNKHMLNDGGMVTLLENINIRGLHAEKIKDLLENAEKTYLYHEYYVEYVYGLLLKAFPHAIPITARKKVPPYLISIKSFYNSVVQFWVGDGVFMQHKENIFPTIASKNQIKSLRFVDFCLLQEAKLAKVHNYFKYIPIYEHV